MRSSWLRRLDDLEDLGDELRCEPERRLVEHQELRVGHQRPADREHLLLAAREVSRPLPTTLLEARKVFVDHRGIVGERAVSVREGACT